MMLKRWICKFITCLTFIGFSCQSQKNITVPDISYNDLKQYINTNTDFQLIDVRTTREYSKGAIKNALHSNLFNIKKFKAHAETLEKNKLTVLYCHSGKRSLKAAKLLKKMGFTHVLNFSGGWKVWNSNN